MRTIPEPNKHAKSGRVGDARALLQRLEELSVSRYVGAAERAFVYAGLGEPDECFDWLEKAYDERSVFMLFVSSADDEITKDPRFDDLMRRVGLAK